MMPTLISLIPVPNFYRSCHGIEPIPILEAVPSQCDSLVSVQQLRQSGRRYVDSSLWSRGTATVSDDDTYNLHQGAELDSSSQRLTTDWRDQRSRRAEWLLSSTFESPQPPDIHQPSHYSPGIGPSPRSCRWLDRFRVARKSDAATGHTY